MGEFVLGMHAGHNASVCISDRSGLIYAIQEERLTGEKNFWGFPRQALKACMEYVGATPKDIATIAYGGEQVPCKYHSRDDILAAYQRQETLQGKLRQRLGMPIIMELMPRLGQDTLRQHLLTNGFGDVPVEHFDHHSAHAATAYYGLRRSPNEEALVVTCDGAGDRICATVRVYNDQGDDVISRTDWDNSLGAIYSWMTYGLGFVPLEHEYKLMGMAPYASEKAARKIAQIFHRYLAVDEDALGFKRRTLRRTNDISPSLFKDLHGKRFDHICAGLQLFTEEMLVTWITAAIKQTGVGRVLAGGGVFMNVKANQRIAALSEVASFEAFPSCGDESLSLGACYLGCRRLFGEDAVHPLKHYYLGDAPSEPDIEAALAASGLEYQRPTQISDTVADLLAEGHPVARCAGRMEFGARALGNRSILGDPSDQDLVRIINRMVKKRDFWMPFAPMILEERQHDYLQNAKELRSPYMMMTFATRDNFKDLIAAVHNADLTCRAQILSKDQNPAMHAILKAFEQRTGRGVVLNTSFNLHGYPIVRTADEALGVLQSSGLRFLQLGPFVVTKPC